MRTSIGWLSCSLIAGALACGGAGSGGDSSTPHDDGGSGSSGSSGSSGGSSGSSGGSGSGSGSGGSSGSSGSSSGSGGGSGSSSGGPSTGGLTFTTNVQIIVEPSDDADGLVTAIQNAKTSVHMTMYLLTSTRVIDAVIAQTKAGHDVKVLLNETFPSSGADSGSNMSAFTQLQAGGVNVKWAPAGFTYTHEKGVMIDGQVAWIMTMNATETSATANREYLAVDSDADDVAEAEKIFAADFADASSNPSGKLVVSPTNSSARLLSLLQLAKTSIDMEAEELTDSGIVGALESAAGKGVTVHVVLADASSTSAAAALKTAGVKLVTYTKLYVHAKSIVIDGTYAYVGSENFSTGSLGFNRELGVFTSAASEVAKVETTTASDFAAGSAL